MAGQPSGPFVPIGTAATVLRPGVPTVRAGTCGALLAGHVDVGVEEVTPADSSVPQSGCDASMPDRVPLRQDGGFPDVPAANGVTLNRSSQLVISPGITSEAVLPGG